MIYWFCFVVLTNIYGVNNDSPPSFSYIISDKENSALSMSCAYSPEVQYIKTPSGMQEIRTYEKMNSSKIDCNFERVSFSKASNEDKIQSEKSLKEIEKMDITEISKEFGEGCQRIKTVKNNNGTIEQKNFHIKVKKVWEDICNCIDKKDKRCFVEKFTIFVNGAQDVCKLQTTSFKVSLKKVSTNKWKSDRVPSGLCDVVWDTTIETDGKHKWTYTQKKITFNSKSKLCKEWNVPVGYTVKYSSENSREFLAKCTSFKFGY